MSLIDLGLYAGYVLIFLCAITAIIMPLIQSFGDPKSLVKSGIGVGILLVVLVVTYTIADGSSEGASETTSKMVGAGLLTMYAFVFAAIAGIVYTEISKFLK